MAQRSQGGGNMRLETIKVIIQKTFNGSSIHSFNIISGEKITFRLKEISARGTLIFLQKGCKVESTSDTEIETEPSMIESITYFPSGK